MASSHHHHDHHHTASLMALRVEAQPTRATTQPIHALQLYERFHELQQSTNAGLSAVVDHLVVCARVTAFVSVSPSCPAGVRVSGGSQDAVESIDVRVHHDTGLEVYAKRNCSERMLVEVFLPSPQSLRSLEARDHATVVLESTIANDVKADVRIHHVGECEIFVSSVAPLSMNSLTLEPQGGGRIQLIAPALELGSSFHANIPAMGKVRVFTGKLVAPFVTVDTAGYGSVQIAALELNALAKLSTSAVGQAYVTTIGDTFRATQLKGSAAGMGEVNVLAFHECTVSATECDAQGAGAIHVASHYAHGDVTRVSVAGKGVVDARDLVAREADIHAAGAATAVFRASEMAHVSVSGYGTATLVGVPPPRITGRPNAAPAMPSLVEQLAAKRRPPVAMPSRRDAFEPRGEAGWAELQLPSVVADFTTALKSLWGGHREDPQAEQEPAPTP